MLQAVTAPATKINKNENKKYAREKSRNFKDKIEMRLNTIPSAVVSANTGGVPVGREDDAATADVVVAKLKQPLSPAEKKKYNWI